MNDIDGVINQIKEKIKNLNINEENIQKETFYVNTTNLLDGTQDKTNKNKIKHSKYYDSDIISLYEEHVNPFKNRKKRRSYIYWKINKVFGKHSFRWQR